MILQDQVLQGICKELQDAKLDHVISFVALHSLAVVVTTGCAILLLRTAAGTLKSRFLRHYAISIIVIIVFRLGSIAYLLLKALLAAINDNKCPVDERVTHFLTILNSTWNGIDIVISLLSTLFLFVVWDLLRRYPKEGVGRLLFTVLAAAFGSTSLLAISLSLLALLEKVKEYFWQLLVFIDVTGATIALWLVGWQLQKTLGPHMKTNNRVVRATLLGMTAFAYFIWGIHQPVYFFLNNWPGYSISLLMSGLSAIIMTIILCSQALEEKTEYESDEAPLGDDP